MIDSLTGKQLDSYRLEALIGRGGMARVYRAWDTQLRRYATIKVMDAPFEKNHLARFQREAQAIAGLEHPNIVVIYHIGQVEDIFYMAMRFVEGANLGQVLAKYHQDGERIAPKEALRIVQEVCSALDYAHSQGVIHRDVKPSNILLDKKGRAILSDFGLALLTELGTRGEIFGTPYYIAPEQAVSSAKAVPQSDLYSVGVIVYEMFTGRLPFDADEPVEAALKHLQEKVPSPRQFEPTMSAELENVILKALAKNPRDRYQTGKELADALQNALKTTPKTRLPRLSIPEVVRLQEKVLPPTATAPFMQTADIPSLELSRSAPRLWMYFVGGALVTLFILIGEVVLFLRG